MHLVYICVYICAVLAEIISAFLSKVKKKKRANIALAMPFTITSSLKSNALF